MPSHTLPVAERWKPRKTTFRYHAYTCGVYFLLLRLLPLTVARVRVGMTSADFGEFRVRAPCLPRFARSDIVLYATGPVTVHVFWDVTLFLEDGDATIYMDVDSTVAVVPVDSWAAVRRGLCRATVYSSLLLRQKQHSSAADVTYG